MIRFDNTFDDGKNVWFIGNENNVLYCMDYDLTVWAVLNLNLNEGNIQWGSPYCAKFDDLLICLPSREKSIKLVNLDRNEIEEVKLDISAERYNIPYCVKKDNYLWCLSTSSGELIKIDTIKKEQANLISVFEKNTDVFTGDMICDDQNIYAVYPNTRYIVEFDIKSETTKYKEVNINEQGFSTILVFNNTWYLTGYRNAIYVAENGNFDSVIEIDLRGKMEWSVENMGVKQPRFRNSYLINDEWALFIPKETKNYRTDRVVAVNCISHEIKIFDMNITKGVRQAGEILVFSHYYNGEIVIYDYMIDKYIAVNIVTGKMKIFEYKINHKKTQEFYERCNARDVVVEDDFIGLTNLISILGGEKNGN